MEASKRIVINTMAQYSRSAINTVLSLFSTRIILNALGVSDFGIYAVVGGVVAMLGFITNALIVTTQRYISFCHGRDDSAEARRTFANSLLLHLAFAACILSLLLALREPIVNHWMNISPDRVDAAKAVYAFTAFILASTIVSAPFKAVLIAHENIVYVSLVEVGDAVLKLLIALGLSMASADKLVVYAACMAAMQVFNLLAFACYANLKYAECKGRPRRSEIDRAHVMRLLGFAGWTTYGTGAVVLRNQGISLMLNNFFGTVINAAYGIAFQVYGALAVVSSSILNAMNPQIMKAEGAYDRQRMIRLAMTESKFSSALIMLVAIPVMSEMGGVLAFWLTDVPPHTEMFCKFILASFLLDQLTYGLNSANQAVGRIRTYTLLMYTPKLLILPAVLILLHRGGQPIHAMMLYAGVEAAVSAGRLFYMRQAIGLNIAIYAKRVLLPLLPLAAVLFAVSQGCTALHPFKFRFVLTFAVTVASGCAALWAFTLSTDERQFAKSAALKRAKGI